CSRREADKLIDAGRVSINGVVAQKGNRVEDGDEVLLDGRPLKEKPAPLYLMLHKPPGITCTTDLKDRDNIIHFINHPQRIFPIGRLDKASTGLILLTNDGDIVNEILREENNHEKEYVVKVNNPVTPQFLTKMASGVPILGTVTKRCRVEAIGKFVFRIILTQGMNRQIRRMCEALGYKVVSLKRIRVMHLELGTLKPGEWRELNKKEVKTLQQMLER
ncbi:MAG: pseudouridine synthase, partial [Saprospiraceae bacterium]|nr:pseudouridine synthase [Saprospiraceae bacterium]